MARAKKKPNYNPETIMKELLYEVSALYVEAGNAISILRKRQVLGWLVFDHRLLHNEYS